MLILRALQIVHEVRRTREHEGPGSGQARNESSEVDELVAQVLHALNQAGFEVVGGGDCQMPGLQVSDTPAGYWSRGRRLTDSVRWLLTSLAAVPGTACGLQCRLPSQL